MILRPVLYSSIYKMVGILNFPFYTYLTFSTSSSFYGYGSDYKPYSLDGNFLNKITNSIFSDNIFFEIIGDINKLIRESASNISTRNNYFISIRDIIYDQILSAFPVENFNMIDLQEPKENFIPSLIFLNEMSNYNYSYSDLSDINQNPNSNYLEINPSSTSLILIENLKNYNYILFRVASNSNKKSNNPGGILYSEIFNNFYQNFSVREIYTNNNYDFASLYPIMKSQDMSLTLNDNIINCFWIQMNLLEIYLLPATVMQFDYTYTNKPVENSPIINLNFKINFTNLNNGSMSIANANSYNSEGSASQQFLTNTSQWQFICIHQNLSQVNEGNFNLKIETWSDDSKTLLPSNTLINSLTISKYIKSSSICFNFILKNFNKYLTLISGFNMISYSNSNNAFSLMNLLYNFRFNIHQVVQYPTYSILFNNFVDYSYETISHLGFTKISSNQSSFSSSLNENFISSIFAKGYPKFTFNNYGTKIKSYDITIKFDGEILLKSLINSYDLKMKINCLKSSSKSNSKSSDYSKEFTIMLKYFKKYTFKKISVENPIILIQLFLNTNLLEFNFNINSEILARRNISIPEKNSDFFDFNNYMIMTYNDTGYDENNKTVKLNLSKFFIRNYYNTIATNFKISKLTSTWTYPKYSEVSNEMLINQVSNFSSTYQFKPIISKSSDTCSEKTILDYSNLIYPSDYNYLQFMLQKSNTENVNYESSNFYPSYIAFSTSLSIANINNNLGSPTNRNSTYYKIMHYENLRLFLSKNFIQISLSENVIFLTIKIGDPKFSATKYFKFNYVSFPDKGLITTSNLLTSEKLVNSNDNLLTYRITFMLASTSSDDKIKKEKFYFIDAVYDKSQFFLKGLVDIYIIFEPLGINQIIFSNSTTSGLQYFHLIYLTNSLYPLKFIKKSFSTSSSISSNREYISYFNKSVLDEIFPLENTVSFQLNSGPITNLFYSLNLSRFTSSLTWGYPKLQDLPFYKNILTPSTETTCTRENGILFLKTNLRFLLDLSTQESIILSIFENNFTIFFNPTCKCTSYEISTSKGIDDKKNIIKSSLTKISYFQFTTQDLSEINITMTDCINNISIQNSSTNVFKIFKILKFEKIKFLSYTGKKDPTTGSDQCIFMPDKNFDYLFIKVDYQVTNEVLLSSKLFSIDNKLCSYFVRRYNDKDSESESKSDSVIKYEDHGKYHDCFGIFIKNSETMQEEKALSVKLNYKYFIDNSDVSISSVINLNFGNSNSNSYSPQYSLSVLPSSGYFDSTKFTVSFTIQQISSLQIDVECFYFYCYEGKSMDGVCKKWTDNKYFISETRSTETNNFSIDFMIKSEKDTKIYNIDTIQDEAREVVIGCKLTDSTTGVYSQNYYNSLNLKENPNLKDNNSDPSGNKPDNNTTPPNSKNITESLISPPIANNTYTIPNSDPSGNKPDNNTTPPNSNNKTASLITPPIANNPYTIPTEIVEQFKNSSLSKRFDTLNNLADNISVRNSTNSTYNSNTTQDLETIILINNLLFINNCENISTNSTSNKCKEDTKLIQDKLIENLSVILNCESIFNTVFNSTFPSRELILSALSLFYSTTNYNSFSNSSTYKIADITSCLIQSGPIILTKLNEDSSSKDFVDTLAQVSSNIIDLSSSNFQTEYKYNYLDVNLNVSSTNMSLHNSLMISNNTLKVKSIVEDNAVLWMKYTKPEKISNRNGTQSSLSNNELESKNFILKREKLNFEKNSQISSRILIGSTNELSSNISDISVQDQIMQIKSSNSSLKIFLPVETLLNYSNSSISNYGAILYNQYPLLNPNPQYIDSISQQVISLKMFDEEFNNIPVHNLSQPIKIMIKKPDRNFTHCIFFNSVNNTWDNSECTSQDMGDYMLCTCNHLTDFTLSKYDPIAILKGTIDLFKDARIMNDLKLFDNLTWENAIVVKIFSIIFFIYILGLIFTIIYDCKQSESAFILQSEYHQNCCSQEETIEMIIELKEVTEGAVNDRRKSLVKQFFVNAEKNPGQNQKILEILKIHLEKEKSISHADTISNLKGKSHSTSNRSNFLSRYLSVKKKGKNTFKEGIEMKNLEVEKKTFDKNSLVEEIDENLENKNCKISQHSKIKFSAENQNNIKNEKDVKIDIEIKNSISNNCKDLLKQLVIEQVKSISVNEDKIKINDVIEVEVGDFMKSLFNDLENSSKDFKMKLIKEFRLKAIKGAVTGTSNCNTQINRNLNLDLNKKYEPSNKSNKSKNPKISKNDLTLNSSSENLCKSPTKSTIDNLSKSYTSWLSETNSIDKSIDLGLIENPKQVNSNQESNSSNKNIIFEEIEIKNEWFVKISSLFSFFFKTEYRLLVLILTNKSSTMSKTNTLSLTVFRLFCGLSICALLSPSNSISNRVESFYANRDMSVAVATIILIDIPFTCIELLLTKSRVHISWSEGKKRAEKIKAIIIHIFVYLIFLCTFILGLMNTTWVYLYAEKEKREVEFINDFVKSVIFDYLIYEVIILSTKTLVFFSIIKNDEICFWKRCLIGFITVLPWLFALSG